MCSAGRRRCKTKESKAKSVCTEPRTSKTEIAPRFLGRLLTTRPKATRRLIGLACEGSVAARDARSASVWSGRNLRSDRRQCKDAAYARCITPGWHRLREVASILGLAWATKGPCPHPAPRQHQDMEGAPMSHVKGRIRPPAPRAWRKPTTQRHFPSYREGTRAMP